MFLAVSRGPSTVSVPRKTHALHAYAAMASMAGSSHVIDLETIEDSEPEREVNRAVRSSSSSRESQRLKQETDGVCTLIPSISLPSYTLADDSDSEIEIILVTSLGAIQGKTLSKDPESSKRIPKRRSDSGAAPFKSAAVLLQEDKKKKTLTVHPSLQEPAAPISPIPAHQVTEAFSCPHDPRFEQDNIDLPTSLQIAVSNAGGAKAIPVPFHGATPSHSDSPSSLFRSSIARFRAPKGNGSASATASTSHPVSKHANSRSISSCPSRSNSNTSILSESSTTSSRAGELDLGASLTTHVAPSQLTIPSPYLALISSCPVCKEVWIKAKTATSKLSHVRKCASARQCSEETVLKLTEGQIRQMQEQVQEERRRLESQRTLFETTVSKKGKEVSVVGVERKTKKYTSIGGDSDIENMPAGSGARMKEVVLHTQGGSTHSQATASQVQKDLNSRIKINQKITRGDSVVVLQPNSRGLPKKAIEAFVRKSKRNALQGAPAAHAVGSKTWNKATELLAKSAVAQMNITSESSGVEMSAGEETLKRTGRLENYQNSRFRLAEKAQRIAAARSIPKPVIANFEISVSSMTTSADVYDDASYGSPSETFPRPYRRSDRPSQSLIDQAASLASDLPYNLWDLAGSAADPIPDRIVVSILLPPRILAWKS